MKKTEMSRLKAEIRGDFKKLSGKKLSEEEKKEMAGGDKDLPVKNEKEMAEEKDQVNMEWDKHMAALKEGVEKGDMAKCKEAHEAMSKMKAPVHMSEGFAQDATQGEDEKKSMDSLQKQVDELNTQMARYSGMMEELMGDDEDETEMEGEPVEMEEKEDDDDEEKEMSDEEKDKEKKLETEKEVEMSEQEEDDEKKKKEMKSQMGLKKKLAEFDGMYRKKSFQVKKKGTGYIWIMNGYGSPKAYATEGEAIQEAKKAIDRILS
jgi:translation initiation factor IF-2